MKTKEIFGSNKKIAIATALAIVIVLGFSLFQSYSASAVTTDSNTQVTVTYYTGMPSSDDTYEDAYLNGVTGVGRVSYTTKSLGRIQWGEPDASGNYAVYYDAGDIHKLGAYLDESEASYKDLYDKYLSCKKAIFE